MSVHTIEWHEQAFDDTLRTLQKEEEELNHRLQKLQTKKKNLSDYGCQILIAKQKKKVSFDREKFLKQELSER